MWLSLVERCVRDAEAAGSNPVISTMLNVHNGLDRYEHSFFMHISVGAGFICSFLLCW